MNPTEGQRSDAARATDTVALAEAVRRLLPDAGDRQSDLLPLLHAIQREFGHIPDEIVPHVATALNVSRADVHGVLTFYHDFRRTPPGRDVIKVCRAESCRARGAMAIERAILAQAGVAVGATAIDGRVTIDRIHCFGLCATGPNVMVNGRIHSRVDGRRVDDLLREIA